MRKAPYTHTGWFGMCPVYVADIDRDCVRLKPRWNVCLPLFWLSYQLQSMAIGVCSMADPSWQPTWKILLTGKLETKP